MNTYILYLCLILTWVIILIFALIFVADLAFSIHPQDNPNYHFHPSPDYYDRWELHIINLWIQTEPLNIPLQSDCIQGMRLNNLGECTDAKLHYDIFSIRLMQVLPDRCVENRTVSNACTVDDYGIYILNGKQGNLPMYGGCSVLWHERSHLEFHIIFGYHEEVEEHMWIQKTYPNNKCAVNQT